MNQRLKLGFLILLSLSLIVVMVMFKSTIKLNGVLNKPSSFTVRFTTDEYNTDVQAERWIVVDGSNIPEEQLVQTEDVPGWRILVFGKDNNIFRDKRCSNCIAINTISQLNAKPQLPQASNIKMMSYLYAISHGAKWMYITNHIAHLRDQVFAFNTEGKVKGLLYTGNVSFDPNRHFGVEDISVSLAVRNQQSSFQLGAHVTPSVQSRWWPKQHISGMPHSEISDVACRLPHVLVPSQLFPSTDLMGSLIEYKSFWALGSLIGEFKSPAFSYWWLWLMRAMDETIGIYPPLCGDASETPDSQGMGGSHAIPSTLNDWKCDARRNFFACGILLAKEMINQHKISLSDDFVLLIEKWLNLLILLNFKEPERVESENKTEEVHTVRLEPLFMTHTENHRVQNPFKFCKQTDEKKPISVPPIRDILLIIIYNGNTYYQNFRYYDHIYRKYFTNIIYCGSKLENFAVHLRDYQRPVSFLELGVDEMSRGASGYLCSATAMEMGFRVGGYLQMSDDVLFNVWNVISLPRDKIWFQSSIRKGTLTATEVPNIALSEKSKTWRIWPMKNVGIVNLNKAVSALRDFMDAPEKSRVVSFLKQLNDSFGTNAPGAFYEASDIFYVTAKYKDDFNFFSKQFSKHHVFHEIAVPTMLCGLDNINNIVRLNGTYLWHEEAYRYMDIYSPKKHFLHPWKMTKHLTNKNSQNFLCTKYLPYVDGKPLS